MRAGLVLSPAGMGHSKQLLAELSSLLWACRAAQEQMQMPFVKPSCFTQPDFSAAAVTSMQDSQIPSCLQGKASLEPLVCSCRGRGVSPVCVSAVLELFPYHSTQFQCLIPCSKLVPLTHPPEEFLSL